MFRSLVTSLIMTTAPFVSFFLFFTAEMLYCTGICSPSLCTRRTSSDIFSVIPVFMTRSTVVLHGIEAPSCMKFRTSDTGFPCASLYEIPESFSAASFISTIFCSLSTDTTPSAIESSVVRNISFLMYTESSISFRSISESSSCPKF